MDCPVQCLWIPSLCGISPRDLVMKVYFAELRFSAVLDAGQCIHCFRLLRRCWYDPPPTSEALPQLTSEPKAWCTHRSKISDECGDGLEIISTADRCSNEEVPTEISIPTHPLATNPMPLIAFEHLSLYIQKHLSQSVAVCGKVDHGIHRQSRYSAEKTVHVLYFWRAGASRISNMILREGVAGAVLHGVLQGVVQGCWRRCCEVLQGYYRRLGDHFGTTTSTTPLYHTYYYH